MKALPRRILTTALLMVAAAGFIYAFTRPTPARQPTFKDAAIRRVDPAPGDRVIRQTAVFVDLDPAYTGVLSIDGQRIPEDQVTKVGLAGLSFTPGEGKEFSKFRPGRHCASVELWPTSSPGAPHRQYPWCFNVGT